MKVELSNINVSTACRVVACISGVALFIVAIPLLILGLVFGILSYFNQGQITLEPFGLPLAWSLQILLALLYFSIVSIFSAIIYNFVARKWGGIEVTLTDKTILDKFNR